MAPAIQHLLALVLTVFLWPALLCAGPKDSIQDEGLHSTRLEKTVSGMVRDENGGIAGALVRAQTSTISTVTGKDGSFRLKHPDTTCGLTKLTAWAKGYYNGGPVEIKPGQTEVTIVLHKHHTDDNIDYKWLRSTMTGGLGEDQGCAACHSSKDTKFEGSLPVDEWLQDAHSQSAVNSRFLSMYLGTDLSGKPGKPTRYVHTKDYGTFPLLPAENNAYFGPGYKLDFPDKSGNCAACHMPLASVDAPYDTDPADLEGVAFEGINCDFCHKVWDVGLDPVTGLPYENRPGVLSFEFRRPPKGHQFFTGPLDDVAPGEDTFSELQRRSQICAPCHYGVFWGTVIYNSFGEWLESTYSKPSGGKTCQDCHMPHTGAKYFTLPEKGGIARDPNSIFSHRMPGAFDRELLSNAVTMTADAKRNDNHIEVSVTIFNDLTGHHVPTDCPLRHMILLVRPVGKNNQTLELIDGPTLPEWCGTGDASRGYYAGLPGKVFAKVLEEMWKKVSPTAAYWNPTRIVQDNRLAAFAKDTSLYCFSADDPGPVAIEISLVYRRAYKELMDLKGWKVPDIVMEKQFINVEPVKLKK